jgi:hypothetical protein
MRSVIVFDLRSVTSHIKETCCIGMQRTLVDVRNLLGSVRTILMDSIALRICIRARERERGRERERELQKAVFRRMHLQKDMHGICTV